VERGLAVLEVNDVSDLHFEAGRDELEAVLIDEGHAIRDPSHVVGDTGVGGVAVRATYEERKSALMKSAAAAAEKAMRAFMEGPLFVAMLQLLR
jgi:hypothetical protein